MTPSPSSPSTLPSSLFLWHWSCAAMLSEIVGVSSDCERAALFVEKDSAVASESNGGDNAGGDVVAVSVVLSTDDIDAVSVLVSSCCSTSPSRLSLSSFCSCCCKVLMLLVLTAPVVLSLVGLSVVVAAYTWFAAKAKVEQTSGQWSA